MKNLKVYFYCNSYSSKPNKASYHHAFVGLAEGLSIMNVQIYGNKNYWPLHAAGTESKKKYLITHNPNIQADDCDIVLTDSEWVFHNNTLPKNIHKKNRKYTLVHIDLSDGIITASFKKEFRKYDYILKGQYNRNVIGYADNVLPWVYAGNFRILDATKKQNAWHLRKNTILSNFRCMHDLRRLVTQDLYPLLSTKQFTIDKTTDTFDDLSHDLQEKLYWQMTGRRHNPNFYKRLTSAKMSSCFGGFFQYKKLALYKNSIRLPYKVLRKIIELCTKKTPSKKYLTLFQWDSFRLWESFLAGCIPLHVDFNKYGIQMPLMPKNKVHYLGFDLDNMSQMLEMINDKDSQLKTIANAGREWTIKNYTGKGLALQFLRSINYL